MKRLPPLIYGSVASRFRCPLFVPFSGAPPVALFLFWWRLLLLQCAVLVAPPRMHLVMSQVCHSGTDGRFAEVAISVRLICTGLFSERSEGHLLAVQRQNPNEHPTNVYGLGQTVTAYSKPLLASSIVTLKVLPCNCFSKSKSDLIESDNCKTVLSSSLELSRPKPSSDSVNGQL